MYKVLRIVFCVLAVISAASAVFVFVYCNWWGFVSVGAAAMFAGLMMYFRSLQTKQENRDNPPPPEGDFITGRVPKDKDGTNK